MDRLALREELIDIARHRDIAQLRAFADAHPDYDEDLAAAVAHADDEALLVLLVTMNSYAKQQRAS